MRRGRSKSPEPQRTPQRPRSRKTELEPTYHIGPCVPTVDGRMKIPPPQSSRARPWDAMRVP
eukprot:10723971-Heterocapsa_arctica.AAC.1